jgi:hypothetical protein
MRAGLILPIFSKFWGRLLFCNEERCKIIVNRHLPMVLTEVAVSSRRCNCSRNSNSHALVFNQKQGRHLSKDFL